MVISLSLAILLIRFEIPDVDIEVPLNQQHPNPLEGSLECGCWALPQTSDLVGRVRARACATADTDLLVWGPHFENYPCEPSYKRMSPRPLSPAESLCDFSLPLLWTLGLFNLGFWGLHIHRKLGWGCRLMLGSLPLHSLPCLAERCLQVLPLPRHPSRLGSLSHPVRFNPHLPGHSRFDLFRCPPGY